FALCRAEGPLGAELFPRDGTVPLAAEERGLVQGRYRRRALPTTLDGNHAGGRWWGAGAGLTAFGDGRFGLGCRGLDELLDEIGADAVVLDPALQLRRLGARLLEVEDDR